MTAMIGIGAIPGLFNMTALQALDCLDEPEAVHFGYCHKFEDLFGSLEESYERIRMGKKMLATQLGLSRIRLVQFSAIIRATNL